MNYLNLLELSSKSVNSMNKWKARLLILKQTLIEQKKMLYSLSLKRKNKIYWSIPWTKRSRDKLSKKLFSLLSWYHKKKKLNKLDRSWKKHILKCRKSSLPRKISLKDGRNLLWPCKEWTMPYKQSKKPWKDNKSWIYKLALS